MTIPTAVVSEEEWNSKREALLVKEKELTRARDALAAERRGRSGEDLGTVWGLLDITPFGRQEEWQDAPDGVPPYTTGSRVRRHDEYSPEELAGGRTSA